MDRRDFLSLSSAAAALTLGPPVLAKSGSSEDLTRLTLHQASQLVRNKEVSPVELTKACLARIDAYDRKVNAFISITRELAMTQAQTAEKEIIAGQWRGPLHGIPIGFKDNIDTAGIRTTGASAACVTRVPSKDAEVVRRSQQAGAVCLGKLNMNEFAWGSDGVMSFWGPSHNPWKLDCITGGSSSGAAAAVAADFCYAALGTDTGGSVRIPAALCGIVGLKPTYGLVSIDGVIPAIESLDHVGPMCKTVHDTALVLQAIAGHDPDSTGSLDVDRPNYEAAIREHPTPPRLGIPRAYFFDNLEPEVAQAFETTLPVLRTISLAIVDNVVVPDHTEYFKCLAAESLAYHKDLIERKGELYHPFLRQLLLGFATITGADYVLAKQGLEQARRQAAALFQDFDLLVMPTWKASAMKIDDRLGEMEAANEPPRIINTTPFNALGLPAISVPCGFTQSGLPIGLQIVGPPLSDSKVLAFAHAYEQATPWHLRKPKLSA